MPSIITATMCEMNDSVWKKIRHNTQKNYNNKNNLSVTLRAIMTFSVMKKKKRKMYTSKMCKKSSKVAITVNGNIHNFTTK